MKNIEHTSHLLGFAAITIGILGFLALVMAMLSGCTSVSAPCGPDEGLVVVDGEVVHGITQCALCRRFGGAYEARAAELGCSEPFPASACVDEGLSDCFVGLIDEWADFSWAADCESLYAYANQPETYHDFICGDSCTATGGGDDGCCPGTPYALRDAHRCPYWCWGLSECNADAECEALYSAQ